MQHRPFQSFDDFLRVPGMTNDKLYDMMDRLSIDDPEPDDFEEEPPATGTDAGADAGEKSPEGGTTGPKAP